MPVKARADPGEALVEGIADRLDAEGAPLGSLEFPVGDAWWSDPVDAVEPPAPGVEPLPEPAPPLP
jgi:hypothetical protein